MRRRLVVMVKEPRAGRVKTRLGREIGMVPATWWMRHQLRALLRRLRDPRWEICLAVAPDRAVASRAFPADLPRVAQGPGDLGDRMGRVLRRQRVSPVRTPACCIPPRGNTGPRRSAPKGGAVARPSGRLRPSPLHSDGPILIIGADIPGVTPAHIWRAFRALGSHEAVFGPAPDGGYWLIGMKGLRPPPPEFFAGVRWSTGHALTDTLATLPGWRIAQVDTLSDVDTAADL
jgi:glycosyltransferase A (GT-A) superfamily protein (DUF2064 family)